MTPPGEVPAGYAVQYSLDGTNWSTEIPKGTDVGDYTVKVKYVDDDNHTTFDGEDIPVTIALELTDAQKPNAKDNLTYTGEPQELVTAPTAALPEPYRIVYALGDANSPTEEYTTSIPTATDAGTYYVWYKAVGDDNHNDSEAKPVEVTIATGDTDAAAPKEQTLTSNGTPQPLVKPGSIEGDTGTLFYALGSDAVTAPTDGWSTEVPTATEAGTYYVWYKVEGDANHNNVDPACIVVTITEAARTEQPAAAPAAAPAAVSTSDYTLLASLKTSGKKALKMSWTAVPDAQGYDIFFGQCNTGECQYLDSTNGLSYKIKGLKKER